jgi:AcrR family transcriptional regulator
VKAVRRSGSSTTLDDIAQAAGVTKPVVYRALGDKATITLALSEWLIDRMNEAATAATAQLPPSSDRLRAALLACLTTIERERRVFSFVNNGGHAMELVGRLIDRSAAGLIATLSAIRRSTAGREHTPRTWSYAVVGAVQASATIWLRDRYCTLDQLADDLTTVLWTGLDAELVAPARARRAT